MTYYLHVENNKIISSGEIPMVEPFISVEVSEEVYNSYMQDKDLYIWDGSAIVPNPDYEEIKKKERQEYIQSLTMTRRVFALGLQQMGITYSQLKALIATNEQAMLEWDLCEHLNRNNPLLDVMAAQMGITHEQLDDMFIRANSEPPDVV